MAKAQPKPTAGAAAKPVEKITILIPAPAGLLVTVGTNQGPDLEAPPTPIKKLALGIALCEDEDGVQYLRAVTEDDLQGEVQL